MNNLNTSWVLGLCLAITVMCSTAVRSQDLCGDEPPGCCNDNGQVGKVIAASERAQVISVAESARIKRILADVELQARKRDRDRKNRPRSSPLVIVPGSDPNSCMVTAFRRRCRIISNYPVPIEDCQWYPEHYEGRWNDKKKCCEVDIPGYGRVCVTKPVYIWF